MQGVAGIVLVEDRLAAAVAPGPHLVGHGLEMGVVDPGEQAAGSQAVQADAVLGNGTHPRAC